MSIHAELTPEALSRLRKQKRNSTISSFVSSILFLVIVAITLGIFLLPDLTKDEVTIVTYAGTPTTADDPKPTKVNTNIQRKPSAPSSAPVRVIAANTPSAFSIPVPEVSAEIPAVEFGMGDDFGTGWGDGSGSGGGGGMFGSSNAIPGALRGRLFDFKQNRSRKALNFDPKNYPKIAKRVESRRFAFSSFSDYFEAPNELSLTNLAVPFIDADQGPEFFGAKDDIEASGWMAVYHGRVVAPETGRYRFRGAADDYMVAYVNNHKNLVACWPSIQSEVAGSFREGKQTGNTDSPLGDAKLHAGKWISTTAGQPFDISLAIGEQPGGKVGFLLEVEKQGETYRTDSKGRKILPLFTTHPFSDAERKEIQERFPNYEFEWDKVPIFGGT